MLSYNVSDPKLTQLLAKCIQKVRTRIGLPSFRDFGAMNRKLLIGQARRIRVWTRTRKDIVARVWPENVNNKALTVNGIDSVIAEAILKEPEHPVRDGYNGWALRAQRRPMGLVRRFIYDPDFGLPKSLVGYSEKCIPTTSNRAVVQHPSILPLRPSLL